jgi:cytochrome b involved in lipid metabolism
MVESSITEITLDEIKANDGSNGSKLWILIKGKVYDVTNFKHPGGREAFLDDHGEDRWDEFDSIHSAAARKDAEKFYIGVLAKPKKDNTSKNTSNSQQSSSENTKDDKKTKQTPSVLPPLLILVLAYFIFFKYNMLGIFNR